MPVVYRTGHPIADTVADALDTLPRGDYAIGYGILRGMAEKLRSHEHWFNIDRGYFNPGHFDGYYRISYKGTQARFNDLRKPWEGELKPWRFDYSKPVLACPPTAAVNQFFGLGEWKPSLPDNHMIRRKGDAGQINWDDYSAVITFNSSVGWQALQRGIPCLSDPAHSIIGSHYRIDNLEKLTSFLQVMPDSRRELFSCMNAHQFTLKEIKQGKAWPLISRYLSDTTIGKPLPAMSVNTPSASALKARFQLNS